ncbi:MAG: hypothetical protein DRH11_01785 [Deltaproteobacteria bacterium]|nr:MAG: hypothetical protein DRH11_01785 [Deltaproteobacteria bacterium]
MQALIQSIFCTAQNPASNKVSLMKLWTFEIYLTTHRVLDARRREARLIPLKALGLRPKRSELPSADGALMVVGDSRGAR